MPSSPKSSRLRGHEWQADEDNQEWLTPVRLEGERDEKFLTFGTRQRPSINQVGTLTRLISRLLV